MRKNHALVDEQAGRLFHTDEAVEQAKNAAFRLLAARSRSRSEIIGRLQARRFPEAAIQAAVETLERLGMLDDRTFAVQWVERRLESRPMGRPGLERELAEKGVPPDVAGRVLDEMLADRDPDHEALQVLRSRLNRYRGLDRDKALGRMCGLLGRRGFTGDVALAAALRLWKEIEEYPEGG